MCAFGCFWLSFVYYFFALIFNWMGRGLSVRDTLLHFILLFLFFFVVEHSRTQCIPRTMCAAECWRWAYRRTHRILPKVGWNWRHRAQQTPTKTTTNWPLGEQATSFCPEIDKKKKKELRDKYRTKNFRSVCDSVIVFVHLIIIISRVARFVFVCFCWMFTT